MTTRPAAAASTASTAQAALTSLADEFWEGFISGHPTFATIMGDRRFDDRLEDLSPEARDAEIAALGDIATRARAIDAAELDARGRVTRSMLIETVEGQREALATLIDEWSLNPIDGPQVWLVDLVDYQPVVTPEEGRAYVARWRAAGHHLDQVIDGLRRSLARGQVASLTPTESVIDELRGLVATPAADWRLAAPAREPHDDWPAAELESFRADLLAAAADVVVPAFARYLDVIEREILPVVRPASRPGLVHVPGGEATYRALIRYHTSLDLDPKAVHELGLAEIERIDAAFVELGKRVLGTDGLAATIERLMTDPALRFETADEVFEAASSTLARAQAAVPAWFGRLPVAPCEVVPVPSESAPHQTIAYYSWPAMDGSRPGRFYINLHEPETRPRFEAQALAVHEAVPGHRLQLALAQELDGLPAFQRALNSNAFSEGWGLYTERLADEMGLYSSDLDRFGVLSFDAWRACRLVVDTGMHALGWTRDQALAFMRAHTALGDNNIVNEVDRYIAWPGQAISYKIGQLEILRLRALAEARLGEAFDIRTFHDVVLGSGGVGLVTLAGMVGDWLAATSPG